MSEMGSDRARRETPWPGTVSVRLRTWPYPVHLALLAALYVGTATFGLWLDAVSGFATAVWPPTGLALVALVLGGMRLWPGVALGAFLVNAWAGAPLPVAAGMALGNTVEAVLGTLLLSRVRFRPALDRLRDVVGLLGVAVLSTLVSATVGVTSGWLGGVIPLGTAADAWRTWWLGDMNGDLVAAALLFTWSTRPTAPLASRPLLEGGGLLLAVVALSLLVFDRPVGVDIVAFSYLFFPVLIWAALRFGPPGASAATALASALAIWGTAHGRGPFVGPTFHESVLALQAFMSIVAATILVLAAVVAERARAEMRLMTHEAITRLLAEARSPREAIPRVFQTMCESLGWDMGALWLVDREAHVLRYGESWHGPAAELASFVTATRQHTFGPGVGLPGRVWASAEPAWIIDVTEDPNFPRAPMAEAAGLQSAVAFPLRLGTDLLGVMEFFSRERRPPDEALLRMVATVGGQLGHFLERTRAEQALAASEAQLRLVTDSAPVLLAHCDAEGRYRFVNRGYAERFGLSRDDVVGRRIPEVLGEEAYASFRTYVGRVLVGEPVEFEVEVPYQAIGPRWMHCAYVPERDAAGAVRGLIAVVTDVTARKRMEAQLEASLHEKEVLLKEIHHRVKNNFQVISSFLSLQASFIEAPQLRAIFEECQNRIHSMALVHQNLYQAENLAAIDFGAYLQSLGAYLLRSYGMETPRIQFASTVEHVFLTVDTAIPCGLLVNELVSNALRHAFPHGRAGHLWVTLRREVGGQLRLNVRDDGVGLPEGVDLQTTSSFGMRLVGLLARQLRATMALERHPGTSVTLTFVEPTYQARG